MYSDRHAEVVFFWLNADASICDRSLYPIYCKWKEIGISRKWLIPFKNRQLKKWTSKIGQMNFILDFLIYFLEGGLTSERF